MARSVTFNGITRFTPGGITRINAAALNQVVLGANSIVGLIGESEGGAPGSTGGLVSLFDPARSADLFRSGPLVDALGLVFQSSNDPDVPGGASQVYVYKTNNSTSATLSLPAENATELLGTLAAPNTTDTLGTDTTIIDSTLSASTSDDEFNGKIIVLRPYAASAEVRTVDDYVASTGTFTVATLDTLAGAADDYIVLEAEVEFADVADTGSTTTSIVLTENVAMTPDEQIGRWVYLQGTAAGDPYLRQIVDNDATTLTVSPALPAAFDQYGVVQVLANSIDLESKDWGAHTNSINVDIADGAVAGKVATVEFEGEEEVSTDIGGSVIMKVLYKGGAEATGDTVNSTPASTASVIELTTGGLTPSAEVGKQVLINGEYTVITANTATQLTVSPALSAAPAATDAVSIRTVTGGALEVQGAAGAATGLTTTLAGVAGDDLSITFSNAQTLRQLLDTINQNANYEAVAGQGVNADTTLVADFDFGPETTASVLVSTELAVEGTTRDVAALVDYFNDFSTYVKATRSADTGSAVAGCCPPAVIADPVYLSGGTRGVSANSDFQAAMDEMLKVRINSVVPLIDQDLANEGNSGTATVASVAAQLADHVATARGTAQDKAGERGGFIGFRGTKDEVIAQANALNDQDVALCAQNPTALNSLGSLQEFGPRMQAVIGASMRAGVTEVAEPLTHKLLRVSGLTQDASWDPGDLTDANEMIISGVLFAEVVDGVGTRWVRDLTTWVADDNLAYSEGSVRDAVRFVAYGLRTTLVERFTGKKATPATIANVKDAAASFLELTRQDNIIVDSTDPATGSTIKAYHNLKVTSSGDTVRINVGIFPVPGINFQLNDIYLQLPTQSA